MEKENNKIKDIIETNQLDKQDIFLMKIIVFIVLSIFVGVVFSSTGSLWSFFLYAPTMPYMMLPDEIWI